MLPWSEGPELRAVCIFSGATGTWPVLLVPPQACQSHRCPWDALGLGSLGNTISSFLLAEGYLKEKVCEQNTSF